MLIVLNNNENEIGNATKVNVIKKENEYLR
jgi:hypothetical protein